MILVKQYLDGGMLKKMSRFINSVSLTNYRGFKDKAVIDFANINNITFLVGPNNSGKSLITRAFSILKYNMSGKFLNKFSLEDFQDSDFNNLNIESPISLEFDINTSVFNGSQIVEIVKILQWPTIKLCIEVRKINENFVCCLKLGKENSYSHEFDKGKNDFIYNSANPLASSLGSVNIFV